jgi:predicted O-linked N-acetylglucosamine transferase (SPINDLY family)
MQSNSGRSICAAFGLSAMVASGLQDYVDVALSSLEKPMASRAAMSIAQQSIGPLWDEFKGAIHGAIKHG